MQQVEANVGQVLEQVVAQSETGLVVRQSPEVMKFVGFRVDGLPEGRLTADIRGQMARLPGTDKLAVTGWHSGVALIAHQDVRHDASYRDVLNATVFSRWVLEPGRLVKLDASRQDFDGIRLSPEKGFRMPQIMPAERMRVHCPCGNTSFFTWSPLWKKAIGMQAAADRDIRKGIKPRRPHAELPRLVCRCGVKLNAKPVGENRLVGDKAAGYKTEDHPDLQGFAKAYHQDPPVIGGVFPRLWCVYDKYQAPDVWRPQDALAEEIQSRYDRMNKVIRPLGSLISSGGLVEPRSFVIEASPQMAYGWMTEKDTFSHSEGLLDFRKSLVDPRARPAPQPQPKLGPKFRLEDLTV